jgi:hypothetical protein
LNDNFHSNYEEWLKIQQQVNGYSPKRDENHRVKSSKMGGYSPKRVAESAPFLQVGGHSPKKVAAAAKIHPIVTLFYGFWANICQNVRFFNLFTRDLCAYFWGKSGWG